MIAITRFTESCETLAGINHVKLIDRNDLINVIEAFRKGNTIESQEIIECEPRMILGSWWEANSSTLHEFQKIIKQKNM